MATLTLATSRLIVRDFSLPVLLCSTPDCGTHIIHFFSAWERDRKSPRCMACENKRTRNRSIWRKK